MIGLKIKKNMANDARKILLKHSLINLNAKIKRDNDFVIIPLSRKPEKELLTELGCENVEIVDTLFEMQKRGPRSLKDYLKGKIEDDKIDEIRGSFDIIGDIVILEIPEELENFKSIIGEAALNFTKRKAVFRKKSEIKGIIRTREFEHLAGEDTSVTIHQEFGARLMLDVKRVYFSPRLATERKKVADSVKDGEIIVDMFAGVGPFPILIAKSHNVQIYAIDINPEAFRYIKKNIELNKVQDKIIPILGDVREVLKEIEIKADRIIMNLPGSAYEFLDLSVSSLKDEGIIHYYEFASDFNKAVERLQDAAYPRKVEILDKRKVKSKSPGIWHIAVDARVI